MAIEDYYVHTVSVVRLTTAAWGTTATRSTNATFKAAISPYGQELYRGDKKTVFADYKMYCAASRDLTERDVIRWESQDFGIVFVKNCLFKDHHKTVYLKRQS